MPNWKGGATSAATGAATGAMWGSVVPGLGTLAGAGVGGLSGFLSGIFSPGGDGKPKADDTSAIDPLLKSLQGKSDAASAESTKLSGLSEEALAPVLDYFKKILGNDPSAMMAATAPQRGRVIDQYDTARKSIAAFAPRGGESSGAIANSYITEGQDLSALTSTARTEAVGQSAQLGTQLKALGLSSEQLASADLSTVINAILNQENIKNNLELGKSGQNKQLAAGLSEGLGTLLGLYLTRGAGTPKAA